MRAKVGLRCEELAASYKHQDRDDEIISTRLLPPFTAKPSSTLHILPQVFIAFFNPMRIRCAFDDEMLKLTESNALGPWIGANSKGGGNIDGLITELLVHSSKPDQEGH